GAIMQSLPLEKAGVGSAVNDTTRELGGALGVAVFGSLVTSRFHAVLSGSVAGVPSESTHSLGAALQRAATLPAGQGSVLADAARHAYVQSFDVTLLIAASVAVLASGLITWLLRPNVPVEVEERAVELEAA